MADEKQLKDQVVVVTGGGRGIGASIAVACAKEGARIALVARTVEQLNRSSIISNPDFQSRRAASI